MRAWISSPRRSRAAALAAAAGVLGLMPYAAAAVPEESGILTGVWWELQPADGALQPPGTEVPAGGLWLQSSSTGDSAVSALRLPVPAGRRAALLVLTVKEDRSLPGPALVDLCPAAEAWSVPEATPGAWGARAVADCTEIRLPGITDENGSSISFDLTPMADAPVLDLVLTGGDGVGSRPDVTFEPVAPEALRTVEPTVTAIAPPPAAAPGAPPSLDVLPPADVALPPFQPFAPADEMPFDDGSGPPLELGPGPEVAFSPTSPGGSVMSAASVIPVEATSAARDDAQLAAVAALVVLVLWAGSLMQGNAASGPSRGAGFTLYRGAPPSPEGRR